LTVDGAGTQLLSPTHASLALGVPPAVPGTIFALAITGGIVVTPRDPARRGALVAIRSTDEHALVAALAGEQVLTSSRDGNLRVSAHCYNTHEDIDQLLSALARHRALLAR